MALQKLVISDFSGAIGRSSNEKKKIANAARFSKGLDPFSDQSYVTLARKGTKKSSTTVAGLPTFMVDGSPWTSNRFVLDNAGKFYTVSSADSFALSRTVTGCAGEGLEVFDDYAYYAGSVQLGRYGKLSGTPAFSDNFLADGTTDVDQNGGSTGAADYVPPTSIAETAAARQTFTPQRDPIRSITIDVDVVGSGDWTLTVHDANNVLIGSKTIANGSMSTGDVEFEFATPLRIIIGNEYHFHVTSTVADGGVDTGTATDLEDAEFSTDFGILIDADFHMIVKHLNAIVIANERYLAYWDQATYNPNRIVFPPGFETRTLAVVGEYVVAECWKGPSFDEAEESRRYYWDGVSSTFNFFEIIPQGAPNALIAEGSRTLGVYGNEGALYASETGGSTVQITNAIPKLTRGKKVEVYPGAITQFEGRTLFGFAGLTDDSAGVEQGVYELGSELQELPTVLNFPHQVSTGTTQATTLKVGMLRAFGHDLYFGWDDNGTFGVDKITAGDGANASGSWESLIFDGGNPDADMMALTVTVRFEPLTTGQSITPKYKLDRASSFTNGTAASTVGDTIARIHINTRCREAEFGFNVASTSNTFPKITSIELEWDDLSEELES